MKIKIFAALVAGAILVTHSSLFAAGTNDPSTELKALVARVKADIQSGKTTEAAAKKMQDGLAIGTTFPDFSVKGVDGKPLSLADHKGKVVLIDFWATWCPPCRAEIPNVVAAYKKYHDQGFDIIGVSLDQEQQTLLSYTKENGITWPQFFDGQGWENQLAVKYGIQAIPATYLLDGNGVIIDTDLRGDALEQAVAKALPKK